MNMNRFVLGVALLVGCIMVVNVNAVRIRITQHESHQKYADKMRFAKASQLPSAALPLNASPASSSQANATASLWSDTPAAAAPGSQGATADAVTGLSSPLSTPSPIGQADGSAENQHHSVVSVDNENDMKDGTWDPSEQAHKIILEESTKKQDHEREVRKKDEMRLTEDSFKQTARAASERREQTMLVKQNVDLKRGEEELEKEEQRSKEAARRSREMSEMNSKRQLEESSKQQNEQRIKSNASVESQQKLNEEMRMKTAQMTYRIQSQQSLVPKK